MTDTKVSLESLDSFYLGVLSVSDRIHVLTIKNLKIKEGCFMNKQEKKTQQAKMTISEIASSLFLKQGYKNTSVKDICTQSSYSVGAFYYHFNSKSDVLAYMFLQLGETINEKITELSYANRTKSENILLISTEHCLKLMLFGVEPVSHFLGNSIIFNQNFSSQLLLTETAAFEQWIQEGIVSKEFLPTVNPTTTAQIMLQTMRGHIYFWCLEDGEYPLMDNVIRDIKHTLFLMST